MVVRNGTDCTLASHRRSRDTRLTVSENRLSEGWSDVEYYTGQYVLIARKEKQRSILGILNIGIIQINFWWLEPRILVNCIALLKGRILPYQGLAWTVLKTTSWVKTAIIICPRRGVRTLRDTRSAVGLLRDRYE
jgi:hypothetical protein